MASRDEIATTGASAFVRDGIDLRVLARRQRGVVWLVLASIFASVLTALGLGFFGATPGKSGLLAMVSMVFTVVLQLAVIFGTLQLMMALRSHVVVLVLMGLLMIHPMICLIVLVIENTRASRRLRRSGIRVGLLGAQDADVVRMLAPHVCRQCGYDLTGNVSGQCSECGVAIPKARGVVGDGGA